MKRSRLHVACGPARCQLATLPSEDFPGGMGFGNQDWSEFEMSGESLRRALKFCQPAMSPLGGSRPYLEGVYMGYEPAADPRLSFAATESHFLHHIKVPAPEDCDGIDGIILPHKLVQILLALGGDQLAVQLGQSLIQVRSGGTAVTSKLIDGKFPDFEAIIPQDSKDKVTLERKALQETISRLASLSERKLDGHTVCLRIKPDSVLVAAARHDVAGLDVLSCKSETARDVAFTAPFILASLDALAAQEVTLHLEHSSVKIDAAEDPSAVCVVFVYNTRFPANLDPDEAEGGEPESGEAAA